VTAGAGVSAGGAGVAAGAHAARTNKAIRIVLTSVRNFFDISFLLEIVFKL
jgi:hypothetical protein